MPPVHRFRASNRADFGMPLSDGPALRNRQRSRGASRLPAILGIFAALTAGTLDARAGDLLRGGAPAGVRPPGASATNAGAAEAARARANAQDALARTSQALTAVRDMQAAARKIANGRSNLGVDPNHPGQMLPSVPNGLTTGGLEVAPGVGIDPSLWRGANLPKQSQVDGETQVRIRQTAAQAVLNWKTFNVGRETTVKFDQTLGGSQSGQWIAFNKVNDPTGVPSQILGNIQATGQVYIINPNGIIFGGASQVNLRSLVASSLPINDNLVQRGLLNQEAGAAQFLFSTLAQGSFVPPAPPAGKYGDVTVQEGAIIQSPVTAEGNGGRVALVGANVQNRGTISTPSGQTIMAAGLQVGFEAHNSSDPSLRGLDVYIGSVGNYAGRAVNQGLVEIPTGSLTMAGKEVEQNGFVDSTTTVTLNGRIDLLANYDAIPNGDYNPSASGGETPFLFRRSGAVTLGPGSVMRIMPDLLSTATTVGTSLPIRSQANLQGLSVSFRNDASLLAPNADVTIQAGEWRPPTEAIENGVLTGRRPAPDFVYTGGGVSLATGAFINVAGSTDVLLPLAHNILQVQLRGNELAVAPLQRAGALRGVLLTIDLRRSGTYQGRQWIGTPLGDASGFASIIERNAAQLTAAGGTVTIQSGGAYAAANGSVIDVSGGYYRNEGGLTQTTRLRYGANLVTMTDATPDRVYDGIYTGTFAFNHAKWGISGTFTSPLAPLGAYLEPGYLQGAAGGTLSITAPSMILSGEIRGQTVVGPHQLRKDSSTSELPRLSTLQLAFKRQDSGVYLGIEYPFISPTPPRIVFGDNNGSNFASEIYFPTDFFAKSGFGNLDIENSEGDFMVLPGAEIELPATGSLTATGRNISILGQLKAPSGRLSFQAFNYSPYQALILLGDPNSFAPDLAASQGVVALGSSASLDVSGLIVDERFATANEIPPPFAIKGGSISLAGYDVNLAEGSTLDVSGGAAVTGRGAIRYGDAGTITIEAGQDPNLKSLLGGRLGLGAELRGYSGATGGTLAIRAPLIQIGGAALHPSALLLTPEFFSQGGFQRFNLTGLGVAKGPTGSLDPTRPDVFLPAVSIASITLAPVVKSLVYSPFLQSADGSPMRQVVLPEGDRDPVSFAFNAPGVVSDFIDAGGSPRRDLLVRGDILMSADAKIETGALGNIALTGQTVTVLGSLSAPGGTISITGANRFPERSVPAALAGGARPTVHLGANASLSAIGTTVLGSDPFGRKLGNVIPGGQITITGNILAQAGALLDVSGASDVLEFHPSQLGSVPGTVVPPNSGLNSPLFSLRVAPYRVDSNGGSIVLAGSEMLLTDATLFGRAGGPTAVGGTLAVSAGRFYAAGAPQLGSDINLVVTQSGSTIASTNKSLGIGIPLLDATGATLSGMGYFAVDRFTQGGFDSLDLGFSFDQQSGNAYGGNIDFRGRVSINARGFLNVAAGGIIRTDAAVTLTAPYVAIGQAFRAPENPDDPAFIPFLKSDPLNPGNAAIVPPTFGPGSLTVVADLIDIGTLVLNNTGTAAFTAPGGDIRGNGTLSIAGDLTLAAAQIYPTTLSKFEIFAYDHAGGLGSVTIGRSGTAASPLSAGGTLSIMASNIQQGGVLLAPFGVIRLGWDGTDIDLSTPAIDGPLNAAVGTSLATPVTQTVMLQRGSITSVAGLDSSDGTPLLVPFGVSSDGLNWIDPSGARIEVSGLPAKQVAIAGDSVTTEGGSIIDLRGGGDLFSYRWIAGNGGPIDLLGTASVAWNASGQYAPGDLVTYQGRTWSARVSIDPTQLTKSRIVIPTPQIGAYWSQVEDQSFAILPGYRASFAPRTIYNTGVNASALAGDPGYVSSGLKIGDQIYLEASDALAGGVYTLLPRRYALLPGALIVNAKEIAPLGSAPAKETWRLGTYTVPEGSSLTTGYRFNAFNSPGLLSPLRSVFEVLPDTVVGGRSDYEVYNGNLFLQEAATRLDVVDVQRLPTDAGFLSFQGNSALQLDGNVLASRAAGSRGATIEISSFADITIVGSGQTAAGGVVLDAGRLNRFGAERLLIGGLSRTTDAGVVVDVRTTNVTIANAGTPLRIPEITLVANAELNLEPGSQIISTGEITGASETLLLNGSGTLLRVSGTRSAIVRSNVTASTTPRITIGAGVFLGGESVILDSTYGMDLSPDARFESDMLAFGAGQISILLEPTAVLPGQLVTPQLVLGGEALASAQQSQTLSLISYQNSIDFYGTGTFGSPALESLSLQAGEIRGFNQGAGTVTIAAAHITLTNRTNAVAPGPIVAPTGTLVLETESITIGAGALAISQFSDVTMNATGGLLFQGTGGLTTQQNLTVNTPALVAASLSTQGLTASEMLTINSTVGPATVAGGIGGGLTLTGSGVAISSEVLLPSGLLEIHAVTDDITIGGKLDVSGIAATFYDVIRYSGGGQIRLIADHGDVSLLAGSDVSVAAPAVGGDAGSVIVSTPGGIFTALGSFQGEAGANGAGGNFQLDAESVASFTTLTQLLEAGGFTEARNFRIRTGDLSIDGISTVRKFTLSLDAGSITVAGTIDASGATGGKISLIARDSVILAAGSILTVAAQEFDSAGKGGEIHLEAGSQINGQAPDPTAQLDLTANSTIDLSVADYVAGDYTTPYSSAFYGQFTGTLHLRAPRVGGSDLAIKSGAGGDRAIGATILGASSIIAEGYAVYDLTASGGLITGWRTTQTALPTVGTVQRTIYDEANSFLSAVNHTNMVNRLLGSAANPLAQIFVIAPGAEIINRNGDLTLGLENGTTLGSALLNSADWNLSDFRFGPKQAPGILTLRAKGNIVFNNALSDGFTPIAVNAANGYSSLWLGLVKTIDPLLPTNTQSWSYRLTSGADFGAASFSQVIKATAASTGSIYVGQFYPAVPNTASAGATPGVGEEGLTANSIAIAADQDPSLSGVQGGTRFEVIRTGTGSITINASRDVQLRNQFATIYTMGARIATPQNLYGVDDFRTPSFYFSAGQDSGSRELLGRPQQYYGPNFNDGTGNRRMPQWTLAGGDIFVDAGGDIGRFTMMGGSIVADTSRQTPNNWLFRRGAIDPNTGTFAVVSVPDPTNPAEALLVDPSASTTWWSDPSNFFQGFGALGGGNISLLAGNDIVNADAVIPTSARMSGRDAAGNNIAPNEDLMLELGGGDLTVRAGRNIDGGIFYVERGHGTLAADGEIKTNESRALSFGILDPSAPALDSRNWLPTTLFLGKGDFDVSARGDVLLGPILNTFLLPQGLNNRPWYRTYFSTYASDSSVSVSSLGGDVTHRLAVTLPGKNFAQGIFSAWLESQNLYTAAVPGARSSYYQPWIRLNVSQVDAFSTITTVLPPTLRSTAFAGDINISGTMNLFPSATGTLELVAAGGVNGLQDIGIGLTQGVTATAWISAQINLSDADPLNINAITTPSGPLAAGAVYLQGVFNETGSSTGSSASADVKRLLHAAPLLHAADPQPLRIYASQGDISSITLFAPKASQIVAGRDVTDIAFYLQNANADSISIVSAGRDVLPYNVASRSLTEDLTRGNFSVDPRPSVSGAPVSTTALAGDIQINGAGTLEVLAGRNVELGTGPNFDDGRGVGVTSIGKLRNPYLPFEGANLVVFAGVSAENGGAALGLAGSTLQFEEFAEQYGDDAEPAGGGAQTEEETALAAVALFFRQFQLAANEQIVTGSYASGFAAIDALFGTSVSGVNMSSAAPPQYGWGPWKSVGRASALGDILTRSRDIRTGSGGSITLLAPLGALALASDITGNPLTPPGIVTEFGGPISIFTNGDVDIGQARIFTLRGGDLTIWSTAGNIAAGTAPKTVVTAPPTRVSIDTTSADIQTDLGGLATGGGIGVLASVAGVEPGNVYLIAPSGTVDAGDAGIRATGDLTIAAVTVLNADNIAAAGSTVGVPTAPTVAAPNISGLTAASNTAGAASSAADQVANQAQQEPEREEPPSIVTVEVLGYGGGEG